jgi:hypothetical protein
MAVIGIAGLVWVTWQLVHAHSDWTRPVIDVMEGDVSIGYDEGECFLRSGAKKLRLRGKAPKFLLPGGPYRVFYLDGLRLVVSAEVLPGWRPTTAVAAKKRFPFSIEIG